MNKPIITTCCLSILFFSSYSYSYENKDNIDALNAIKSFADNFCIEIPLKGEGVKLEYKGNIKAEPKWLIKKIADLDIIAGSSVSIDKYTGLVRDKLPDEIKDRRKCKQDLWKDLKEIFFPSRVHDDSNETSKEENSSTYSSSDAGTSSLTSKKGACAAWAGPNGANSTCANIEGKGVSTRAADDGANSAAE